MKLYRSILAAAALAILAAGIQSASAQSTDQSFPTPVTSNEISGMIRARDIGDSRLTSYFYVFNGEQGDVFINVVSKNFNGDIDVFAAEGLRPLTKIVMYADSQENETGRVVYLRKPEKLILRVQGRTPNDDPAEFRIKFAGSFRAADDSQPDEQPELPKVAAANESGIQVNSVGTIVAVTPKPTPAPKEEVAERREPEDEPERVAEEVTKVEPSVAEKRDEPEPEPVKKLEVVITDELAARKEPKPKAETEVPAEPERKAEAARREEKEPERRERAEEPAAADPMASFRLVIVFRDGGRIERPMTEVLRFTVDRGILTVISTNGTVGRYQMANVASVTIQ